jgi:predicted membrane protein
MDFVNDITLEFLMNKKLYDRMGLKSKQNTVERKERRMYRKRIIALTCELLLNKGDNFQVENEDVVNSFRQYTKNCIQFFKATDENDLYQKELETIQEGEQDEHLDLDETTVSEDNATVTLDKTNVDKTNVEAKVFKEVVMNPTTPDYVKIDTMKLNASMDFYLNK